MYMFSLFVLMIFSIVAFKRFILCKRLRAPNGFPIFCDVFNNPICVQIFVSPYLLIISIVHLGKFQIHFSKSDFLRLQQIIKNLKELCTFITFGSSKCRSSCKLEYALLTWQAVLVTRAACPRPSRRRNRLPWSRASRRSRGTCRLWQGIYSSPITDSSKSTQKRPNMSMSTSESSFSAVSKQNSARKSSCFSNCRNSLNMHVRY